MQKKYSDSVKIKYPPSEKKLIKLLNKNIDSLVSKVPSIKKVVLFGSYSRKKPHYGSDVDLLIIVTHRTPEDFEIIYETLYEYSLEYEWSPLIITENRFEVLKNQEHPFLQEILKDGIQIWAE